MQFQLFHDFESVAVSTRRPHATELFAILARFRDAVRGARYEWSAYPAMLEYANVCFWAIRKLEYSFAAEAFGAMQRQSRQPLRILDVGCGVVPLCNWLSNPRARGHRDSIRTRRGLGT